MNRITRFVLVVCIVLPFISSCAVNSGSIATAIPVTSTARAFTSGPVNTPTHTLTSEATLTPTPLSESLPLIKTQCVNDASSSSSLDLQGVIVLKHPEAKIDFRAADETGQLPDIDVGFFLLSPNRKKIIKSIDDGFMEQVSPGGKYLAYIHADASWNKKFLGIMDGNGKVINDFALFFDGSWQDYYNWQNLEKIRILAASREHKLKVTLLNPITKDYVSLLTDWADVYKPENPLLLEQYVKWKLDKRAIGNPYGANILYDPTLTRVVYPKDDGVVSVVNVESEKELVSARFTNWGRIPSWSPNGEYLTILNREGNTDEFYLIPRDGGKFQRITNFAEELGFVTITDYTWSPDSKQIAFWLNTGQDEVADGEQSELAIMDISSKQVTRLCIQGISANVQEEPWTMLHPEPVWSPDGKYVMFAQWDDIDNPKNFYVLVVDPITGELENISQNTAPIGWMINNP